LDVVRKMCDKRDKIEIPVEGCDKIKSSVPIKYDNTEISVSRM